MEDYNEKFKKVMSVLCAVGTIAAFTTFANASSYHTSSNLSAAHTQGDGSTYFQKVEYHVGSTKPFDDAYIYTEAAAIPNLMRQTYYYFAGHHHEQHNYSYIGSGIQSISDGYKYSGHDTGTGNCYSKVYSGNSLNSSLVNSAYLTIS